MKKQATEREVNLCVYCPLKEAYISVVGNCVESRISEDSESVFCVRIHGEPDDIYRELTIKCEHMSGIISKPFSRDLIGITCLY